MIAHKVMPRPAATVVAACFGGRPEREWLEELAADGLLLTFVQNRVALIARVLALRPRAVLFPVRDALGVLSAPLISRLREHAPDTRVLLLGAPGSSSSGLAEAIRAGGEPAIFRCASELRVALLHSNHLDVLSTREYEAVRALTAGIHPPALLECLFFCVLHAHQHLSVGDVAKSLGVSRRTFSRHARAASWPTPAEVIDWGRLLRASILQWRESSSLVALAHASGFRSSSALQRTAVRLLTRPVSSARDLSPLRVSSRLHRRIESLARDTRPSVPP